jgi:hypothetical protein
MVRVVVKEGGPNREYPEANDFGFNQFGMVVITRMSNVRAIDGAPVAPKTLAVVNLNNVIAIEIDGA